MARYDDGFLRAVLIGYESEKAKIQAPSQRFEPSSAIAVRGGPRLREPARDLLFRKEGQ